MARASRPTPPVKKTPSPDAARGLRALTGNGLQPGELELGRVSGVFGFKGELRLFLHNPETEVFEQPRRVVLLRPDGARFEATLSARPGAGKRVLGWIDGIVGEEAANAMVGFTILIDRDDLPEPDEGFYVSDVLGWPVFAGDRQVGTVVGIHATDGDDVLEVGDGTEPFFVVMNERFVLDVDFDAKRVVIAEDALVES